MKSCFYFADGRGKTLEEVRLDSHESGEIKKLSRFQTQVAEKASYSLFIAALGSLQLSFGIRHAGSVTLGTNS